MSFRKKIAIIGAALFQEPVIAKAKEMGLETHVFAWATGDPGEKMADVLQKGFVKAYKLFFHRYPSVLVPQGGMVSSRR